MIQNNPLQPAGDVDPFGEILEKAMLEIDAEIDTLPSESDNDSEMDSSGPDADDRDLGLEPEEEDEERGAAPSLDREEPNPANVLTLFDGVADVKLVLNAMPNFELTGLWEVRQKEPQRILAKFSAVGEAMRVNCRIHKQHKCYLWIPRAFTCMRKAECLAVRWAIAGVAYEDDPTEHYRVGKAAAKQLSCSAIH